jgi:hypothetical protein
MSGPLQELLLNAAAICSFCRARLSRLLKTMKEIKIALSLNVMLMESSVVCLGRMYPPPSQSSPVGEILRLIRKVTMLSLCHAKWDCVLIVTLQWNISPYSDITHCSSTCDTWTAAS